MTAIAASALAAAAPAGAATKRSADTSTYTSASYLHQALGLPSSSKHIIESVTYDRFQWLLQQPGQFAFLIGDPATDPTFAARAQAVEEAAEEKQVKRIYWFNPNLSGSAKLGPVTLPNLDVRNPAGITSLDESKAAVVGRTWLNVVGKYLGNGIKATDGTGNQVPNGSGATVTAAPDASVVNDYGSTDGYSTEVGDANGGALYQYVDGNAPTDVSHSVFFLYDKDKNVTPAGSQTAQPAKIVAWVDLTEQPSQESTLADVKTAIDKCGASLLEDLSEFAWWRSSNNAKQATQAPNAYQGSGVPNLTAADGATENGGWRVHQITYPELIHLLKTERSKEAVILFGGTWCPNTRPVLPSINRYAQDNDVTVFNFDTILDGGVVGGGNSGNNPLQSRGNAVTGSGASTISKAVPSWLYGELVARYLKNIKTENAGNSRITYYPGGDTTAPLKDEQKLQVPFLIGYTGAAGDEPIGGITRQWLHTKADGTYTEYMSQWWWTNPQQDQLGVASGNLLRQTPAWAKLNTQLESYTWQTDLSTVKADTTTDADAKQYLTPTEKATVTYTAPSTFAIAANDSGIAVDEAALSAALAALDQKPANNAAAQAAYVQAVNAPQSTANDARVANLKTVVGAWGIALQRKNTVNALWGNPGAPGSIAGGAAAVRAAEVFFAGLPDRAGTGGTGGTDGTGGSGTTTTPGDAVATPPATPSTPASQPSAGATKGPSGTVRPKARVRKLSGAVTKRPTSKRRGRYAVRITVPTGKTAATGTVTVKLKQGSRTKTLRAALRKGVATLRLPRLTKGKWSIAIAWKGDAVYDAEESTGTLKVRK